jgi:hypothetical protein
MHNAEYMEIETADNLSGPPMTVSELAGSNGSASMAKIDVKGASITV